MKRIKELDRKLRNAALFERWAYDDAMNEQDKKKFETLLAEWEQISDELQKIREELAAEIVKATFGQIDSKTAWAMTFKPELHEIIKKIA